MRATAKAEASSSSKVAEPSAAVCEASIGLDDSTELVNVFDFISPPPLASTSPSPIDIDAHRISRPHHISPGLWAAAAPAQREMEHYISKHPDLHYIPKGLQPK